MLNTYTLNSYFWPCWVNDSTVTTHAINRKTALKAKYQGQKKLHSCPRRYSGAKNLLRVSEFQIESYKSSHFIDSGQYKREYNSNGRWISLVCLSFMSTRQKRPAQESSSQPAKKPLLDVRNQGSAAKPTSKLKAEGILKPHRSIANGGVKHVAHSSKNSTGKEKDNGMSLSFFVPCSFLTPMP